MRFSLKVNWRIEILWFSLTDKKAYFFKIFSTILKLFIVGKKVTVTEHFVFSKSLKILGNVRNLNITREYTVWSITTEKFWYYITKIITIWGILCETDSLQQCCAPPPLEKILCHFFDVERVETLTFWMSYFSIFYMRVNVSKRKEGKFEKIACSSRSKMKMKKYLHESKHMATLLS